MPFSTTGTDPHAAYVGRINRSIQAGQSAGDTVHTIFADKKGQVAEIGRGVSSTTTTYIAIFSPDGTKQYITSSNVPALQISSSRP